MIISTIVLLLSLSLVAAILLHYLNRRLQQHEGQSVKIAAVERLLPQTQCGQCGYPGCQPYAQAIVQKEVPINQCPPGGTATIATLAELLGKPILPLNTDCGVTQEPSVVKIREDSCIGCVKCIDACPVDAIMGVAKMMHTVIPELCTGCNLCIPPCPMDCIDVVPVPSYLARYP